MKPKDEFPAKFWHPFKNGRIQCDLCPRTCRLKEGQRGFCYVRKNVNNQMVLTTYGRSSGFCIDPIEKKPLNHFYPGSSVLSFGTAGCNLGCKFCQNWDISKSKSMDRLASVSLPGDIARAAKRNGCRSVAFTYNDPVIFAEYAIDTAIACHDLGIKTVAVTAGYIMEQARSEFFKYIDAANVDLKAFSESFYKHLAFAKLQPVLDTLVFLKNETDVWVEITNLLIPGENDSDVELHDMCEWILNNLGAEVPIHFTAFHPDYKLRDRCRTPEATLLRAWTIARETGLQHVYVGNVSNREMGSSYCSSCRNLVIERDWYELGRYDLDESGCCKQCGHPFPGFFDQTKGAWGRKRKPLAF